MSAKDFLTALVQGGLPQALDYGNAAPTGQQAANAEKKAPTATIQDMEPFTIGGLQVSRPALYITAGLIGLLGVVYFLRR